MTNQEYSEKCRLLKSLAAELQRYTDGQVDLLLRLAANRSLTDAEQSTYMQAAKSSPVFRSIETMADVCLDYATEAEN